MLLAFATMLLAFVGVLYFDVNEPWFWLIPTAAFFLSLLLANWRSSKGPPRL